MTLATSGTLSLSQINAEFGLGLSLSTYRGTTRFLPTAMSNAPPTGPTVGTFNTSNISISEFYGTIRTFVINITGTVYDVNLRQLVINAGWDGTSVIAALCYISSANILSTSTSTPAFRTGVFPTNSIVSVSVAGGSVIAGKGGNGGTGAPSGVCGCQPGVNGSSGGTGLLLETNTWLFNSGIIGGGGGGGGGGGAECNYIWNASAGGGGGGAGFGTGAPTNGCGVTAGRFGGTGANGGLLTGGAGGASGNGGNTAAGGAGGALGQAGTAGQTRGDSGGAGGAAGRSIQGSNYYVGGNVGDIRGITDFFITTSGSLSASVNNWGRSGALTLDSSVTFQHNSAISGPYTWSISIISGTGISILSTAVINDTTRTVTFRSTAPNCSVYNYSVVVRVTTTGASGFSISSSYTISHSHDCSDPTPPPPPDTGGGPTSCFLGNTTVLMSDGTEKRIDQVQVGDRLVGGLGFINTVLALDISELGNRPIYWINETHNTTSEHRHWTERGWASIDPDSTMSEHNQWYDVIVDNNGTKEQRQLVKFTHTPITNLVEGDRFICADETVELIDSIKVDNSYDTNTLVYSLQMSGSHTFVVNNKIVSGWARDDDFSYENWEVK